MLWINLVDHGFPLDYELPQYCPLITGRFKQLTYEVAAGVATVPEPDARPEITHCVAEIAVTVY